MKKLKSVRIDEDLLNGLNAYLIDNELSFSAFIEKAILNNKEININTDYNYNKKGNNSLVKSIRFSKETSEKLNKIVKKKGNTVSEEIRYRVNASLEMPCFDTIELKEIDALRISINQIGNLINSSIRNNLIIDNNNIDELKELLKDLRSGIKNILLDSSKRLM